MLPLMRISDHCPGGDSLIALGTGAAMVTEYYNTCFVLRSDDGRLLLTDGGGGGEIMRRFKQAHLDWNALEGMFITHCHCDHLLGAVWVVRKLATMILRGERQEGMSICALPEVANALRTICSLTLGPKENAVLEGPLCIEAVRDGETRFLAGRECTFFDIHSLKAPQFGFSALLEGEKRFVCMGDEPVDARCSRYALGADWLAAETYCLDSMRDVFHPEKIRHSTVKETAEQAERFGVRNLILWHTEDRATFGQRRELFTEEAARHYSGNVFVPDDLEHIALSERAS
ncbi:MAG TPA: MBL fold metallo-hydrolase [Candidatus Mailhella merdavium]|nr:MBL fold metallo-hydrolase [Candidatus Mailhella merdavium]